MTEYLTKEQRAELERQLSGAPELTGEQARQAAWEGARMAQADMEQAGMEQANGRQTLREYGFESIQEMAAAYERTQATVMELKEMLNQLLAMEKAERTAAELDARHPEYAVRRQIELELRPMREQMNRATRNRMIQKEWQDSAAQMHDLQRLLPEIAEYIMRNPKYADEADGLLRAYDAVRSGKYRDEETMLLDPEFISRMAQDERVRSAVLEAHLQEIRRGGGIPQSIGAGTETGKTPLTGRKPITGMDQAKKRLEAMLGVKG